MSVLHVGLQKRNFVHQGIILASMDMMLEQHWSRCNEPGRYRSSDRGLPGGAATFSGKIREVHKRIQTSSTHAIGIHCSLSPVTARFNSGSCIGEGDKDVFGTMTSIWKLFYYSPKKVKALKASTLFLVFPS